MDEQAPCAALAAPTDRRELAAPVAAWLAGLGFQVVCGPVPGGKTTDVTGLWRAPNSDVFEFRLVAQASWAMCECNHLLGTYPYVCFTWTLVETEQEVRWLLERNREYRRATGASAPPGAARG